MKKISIGLILIVLATSYILQEEHFGSLWEQMVERIYYQKEQSISEPEPIKDFIDAAYPPPPKDESVYPYPPPATIVVTPFPTPTPRLTPTYAPTMNPWDS